VTLLVGLDHVQVAAPPGSEAEARAFYGRLLGLAEVAKPVALAARGGVWFRLGAQELHVGVVEELVPAVKAHPGLVAADERSLRALAERLRAAGHDVAWAEPDEIPGRTRFHTTDPWGNRLELLALA
jgi:catechol 2,3-dioxygenase-like lactoylglutathione lyase family enzyme